MHPPISEALKAYPRLTLTRKPTPLDFLPNISKELGIQLYLKRDDLTDLTLGGDKARKLEYELAQAKADGADILVTYGSTQSNHARLTTSAARRLGMDCALVLSRDDYQAFQSNLLTVYLMGAQVNFVETDDHWDLEEETLKLCDQLREKGHKPHYIPVSGTTPHSCLGYISAGLELADQMKESDMQFDAIYTPFGTGGIFTAMLMALREQGINSPMMSISVNRDKQHCEENHAQWWSALCDLLDHDPEADKGMLEIHDDFIGKQYGDPTEACLDAIMLMARAEGILLDPVYSGKVMAGLLAHLKAEKWTAGQRVLMLHSGGTPALFAYHQSIRAHLEKRGISINL